MVKAPAGALTARQRKKLYGKDRSNNTPVFYVNGTGRMPAHSDVDRFGVMHGKAWEYGFDHTSPHYYFLNYWLAYGYALKVKAKVEKS